MIFFAFLYFKYNENLPNARVSEKADVLASKMTKALNKQAFDSTKVFEWTFKSKRHYKWEKHKNECEVYWKDHKVRLNFDDSTLNQAYVHSFKVDGELAEELTQKAHQYFRNDTFWVFAPYMVFDEGVKRGLVNTPEGEALLVTYNSGDSFLWELDDSGKPMCFKMWTKELPIDGLEASWSDWTTTESGVLLPTYHNILFFGMEISDIKGTP